VEHNLANRILGLNPRTQADKLNAVRSVSARVVHALDGKGPIWQQIRRALADPILSGQWPPGTRIPNETALTKRFRASRMTVGKAVRSLAGDGLVRRHRKIGTLVAERAQERPVFEIWDIPQLVARSGGSYGYRLLDCRKLADDPQHCKLLGVPTGTAILWMRCLHLSDELPFQLEERLVNIEAAPNITCQPLESQSPGGWLLAAVPWTEAQHEIHARAAPRAIAKDMKVRAGTACLVVDRRTWNNGTPVSLARMWHAGSEHHLTGHFKPSR
jgi:GntR family histidine utilization transcriptional repressor